MGDRTEIANRTGALDTTTEALSATRDSDTAVKRVIAGRFELRGELGRGAFGTVFRAFDTVARDEVAIKVIEVRTGALADRVRREVRSARKVTHPNVVRIYDIVEDGDTLVLGMELIAGRTLDRVIEAGGLAPATILRMAREIVAGVAAAHDVGVIHRDLKPANVMVRDGTDTCLVADFGIARSIDGARALDATREGELVGTPLYMAPEQLYGSTQITTAADVYALGLILFELATGARPYEATSLPALVSRRVDGELPPLDRVRPRALGPVIARCLAKEAEARYPDAGALGQVLHGLDLGSSEQEHDNPGLLATAVPGTAVPAATAGGTSKRPRRRRLGAAIAVLTVAGLVGGTFALRRNSTGAATPGMAPADDRIVLRVHVLAPGIDAAPGTDAGENMWLDAAAANLTLDYLRARSQRFELRNTVADANLVVALDARKLAKGVAVEIRAGRDRSSLAVIASGEGAGLKESLESPVRELETYLDKRGKIRGADRDEQVELSELGTTNVDVLREYKYALSMRANHLFEVPQELDPAWPHVRAAMLFVARTNGVDPPAQLVPIDAKRDPVGATMVALLSDPDVDPARVARELPLTACRPSDRLCRLVRMNFAGLTDDQMLAEANQACGDTFADADACSEVVGVLSRLGLGENLSGFTDRWTRATPASTSALIARAVDRLRASDFASAIEIADRLALLSPEEELAARSGILLAAGDDARAADAATRLIAIPGWQDGGRLQLASVLIARGELGRALSLLRTLAASGDQAVIEVLVDLLQGLGERKEAAAVLDTWLASPNGPRGVGGVIRTYQRDRFLGKPCGSIAAVVATEPTALQSVRRLAAEHGCATCAEVVRDGPSGFHRASSNVTFARCAAAENVLPLAASMLEEARLNLTTALQPNATASPFSSIVARLDLAEVYTRQGKREDGLREVETFLKRWAKLDRSMPQIAAAQRLRARLTKP